MKSPKLMDVLFFIFVAAVVGSCICGVISKVLAADQLDLFEQQIIGQFGTNSGRAWATLKSEVLTPIQQELNAQGSSMKVRDLVIAAFIKHPEAPPEMAKVREVYEVLLREFPQTDAVAFTRNKNDGTLQITIDPSKIIIEKP